LIYSYCEKKIIEVFNDSANRAVGLCLNSELKYNDFIELHKNDNGEIVLVQANNVLINKINREIIAKTSEIMSDKIGGGLPIPALAFTGIKSLSGYGPEVYFKALNVRQLNSCFSSKFESAGINQSLHSLYFNVKCEVFIDFPFNKKSVESNVSVLVFESVIVGSVPNYIIGGINGLN
jgi:sporulation protein YunB